MLMRVLIFVKSQDSGGYLRRSCLAFKFQTDPLPRGRETFQMTVQRWTPTKAEAELLVDMLTARLSQAKIAKALYIDVRTLPIAYFAAKTGQ